jgi:membrane protein implicated in regulation of membrane protease activity
MSDTGLPEVPKPGAPSEPLVPVAVITTFVVSAIALGVAFGLPVNDDQQAAILGFIAPAAVIVTVVWSRLKVFSPRTVRQVVQQAVAQERGRHAARDTSAADVRDVKPGWLPPNVDPR